MSASHVDNDSPCLACCFLSYQLLLCLFADNVAADNDSPCLACCWLFYPLLLCLFADNVAADLIAPTSDPNFPTGEMNYLCSFF